MKRREDKLKTSIIFTKKKPKNSPSQFSFWKKNNRPGGWKQGAVFPQNSVFRSKNNDITHTEASLNTSTNMPLYVKSIHISALRQCFCENNTDERIAFYVRNVITSCVIMRYEYALSLAYMKPNILLLANNEILKVMFVKKNISGLALEDSSWHLAPRA